MIALSVYSDDCCDFMKEQKIQTYKTLLKLIKTKQNN